MPGGHRMSFVTTPATIIKFWPDSVIRPDQAVRACALERRTRTFFEIAAAIELTAVEQRILLDVTARELALLRVAPARAMALGGIKLERRVNYAIPILQRMIAAMAS